MASLNNCLILLGFFSSINATMRPHGLWTKKPNFFLIHSRQLAEGDFETQLAMSWDDLRDALGNGSQHWTKVQLRHCSLKQLGDCLKGRQDSSGIAHRSPEQLGYCSQGRQDSWGIVYMASRSSRQFVRWPQGLEGIFLWLSMTI